tara:strand:- start:1214 stop:2023 length:810 start_codon:yes stop_codon:yes gene_type:complete
MQFIQENSTAIKGYLQTVSIGTVNENIAEGSTKTTIQVNIGNLASGILERAEEITLFDRTGNVTTLTLSSGVSAGATTISFNSLTFENEIPQGSLLYIAGDRQQNKIANRKLYAHQSLYLTAGTNGNDYLSAFGTSSFSVNSAVQLADGNSKPNRWSAQFPFFIAPSAGTLIKIKGTASSDAGTGDNATISVWKITPNTGATTNVTIGLINAFSLTSQNNQNHVFDLDLAPLTTLAEGDAIFVSIKRTGEKAGGVKWYADIGITIKTDA